MKLSYTAMSTYKLCSEKWRLHYEERLREDRISSPLIFGSALDEAFGRLLLDKKKLLTQKEEELKKLTAEEVFLREFNTTTINLKQYETKTCSKIDYYKSDLLHPDLEPSQKMYYYSLRAKGLMLIQAYREEVLPHIHEVYAIQKPILLKEGDDAVRGFIDFIASFTDDPETPYVIDNKTSSRPYPDNAVETSEQLAIYCENEGIDHAAYIVVEKKLRKRVPRIRINILRDVLKEKLYNKTFDELTEVYYGIKQRVFTKNYDSCFSFGRKCPYYNLCRKGKDKSLIKLEKRSNNVDKNKSST
jgi:hypothetical protein